MRYDRLFPLRPRFRPLEETIPDHAGGPRARAAGYPIVVGNLTFSSRTMLPLQKVVTVETRVVYAAGCKVMVQDRIFCSEAV